MIFDISEFFNSLPNISSISLMLGWHLKNVHLLNWRLKSSKLMWLNYVANDNIDSKSSRVQLVRWPVWNHKVFMFYLMFFMMSLQILGIIFCYGKSKPCSYIFKVFMCLQNVITPLKYVKKFDRTFGLLKCP